MPNISPASKALLLFPMDFSQPVHIWLFAWDGGVVVLGIAAHPTSYMLNLPLAADCSYL